MIVERTAEYPHNPVKAIGTLPAIKRIEKRKRTPKRNNAITTNKTSFGGKEYDGVDQFEVTLLDDTVLMTVGWDGERLTFHYFGITADENSADCLNEQYEQGIIVRSLQSKR